MERLFLTTIDCSGGIRKLEISADWQEEYARYCEEKGLAVGNESAAEFVRFKDEQLEAAMESGDA